MESANLAMSQCRKRSGIEDGKKSNRTRVLGIYLYYLCTSGDVLAFEPSYLICGIRGKYLLELRYLNLCINFTVANILQIIVKYLRKYIYTNQKLFHLKKSITIPYFNLFTFFFFYLLHFCF